MNLLRELLAESFEVELGVEVIRVEDVRNILQKFLVAMPRFEWGMSISQYVEKFEEFEEKWLR